MSGLDYLELAETLKFKGIKNKAVLRAIANTPRHIFVKSKLQPYATDDTALPIDCEQTISQPFVVARMTEIILDQPECRKVLEIGTGSGYQAAILSQLVDEVYTIERIKQLLVQAEGRFSRANLANIHTLYGDGNEGWEEHAPYDAILVTAATPIVPPKLKEQLKVGGRMVIPVGDRAYQMLQLITRTKTDYTVDLLDPVLFVPLKEGKK